MLWIGVGPLRGSKPIRTYRPSRLGLFLVVGHFGYHAGRGRLGLPDST